METLSCLLLAAVLGCVRVLVQARVMPVGCVWRSSISPTLPAIQEMRPRSECQDGELWWYYPRGALRAYFRHEFSGRDFRLCIKGGKENHIHRLHNETGNQRVHLDMSQLGSETCIPSIGGRVQLLFQAPDESVHVTTVVYTMKPP